MAARERLTYLSSLLILFVQLSLTCVALRAPAQGQSPVGQWTFDDGSGTTAADSSGKGHAATLVNGIRWITGKIGGAISSQSARKQSLTIPAIDLSGTHAVTVTFWSNRTFSKLFGAANGGDALFEATSNYTSSITGFGFFPDDFTCNGIQAALRGNVGYTAVSYTHLTLPTIYSV